MALIQVPTPAALGLAEIATGSCSGATVTITGLDGYDYYNVTFSGIRTGSADNNPDYYLRINGNSTSNYLFAGHSNYTASSQTLSTTGNDAISLMPGMSARRQNGGNLFNITFDNCNVNGFIRYSMVGVFPESSGGTSSGTTLSGFFKVATNLSSLVLSMSGGTTFDQGTYTVWGGRN